MWILCDMQSTTVPIPYEFTEDVICTKLIVYVSNTITSVRILMCIGFVAAVMCMEVYAFSIILGFPHRRNHDKFIGILAVFMILGFPRLPHHRRNHNKCMEIHTFSMILGFPRFPLHRRNHRKLWKSVHFQ